jgi:hypothetical protein
MIRSGGGDVASTYIDRSVAFINIYEDNWWGDSESRSGWGSTLAYTTLLRKELAQLLVNMRVTTLFDAPCGDFLWMSHVALPEGANYIGADIVPALITKLTTEYGGSDSRSFRVIDIVEGPIPNADVWLCRDALIHLPNADVLKVLQNFAHSTIPYLLTTTYNFVTFNNDVQPGGYRPLNLRRPPFNLRKPRLQISDFTAPNPPRYLALWSNDDVRAALQSFK